MGADPNVLWDFRVKVPTFSGGKAVNHVWSLCSAFGVTPEAALVEILHRFPDAQEVLPGQWKAAMPVVIPMVEGGILCMSMHIADLKHWCRYCGQAPTDHPVRSGTPAGHLALQWQRQRDRDMSGGCFWD